VNDPGDRDDGDFENVGWVTHHGLYAQPTITSSRPARALIPAAAGAAADAPPIQVADVHTTTIASGSVLNDPVLIWHRFDVLTTSYNVAVVGAEMQAANVLTRLTQLVQLSGPSSSANTGLPNAGLIPNNAVGLAFNGTYFDRNENIFSTSVIVPVNCFGVVTVAQNGSASNLVDPGSLTNAMNGGWSHLASQDVAAAAGVVTYDIDQGGDGTPQLVAQFGDTNGLAAAGVAPTFFGPVTVANTANAFNQDFGILVYKAESDGTSAVYTSQNRLDF
jgi:hypothetical protein